MHADELREKFIRFFVERGHVERPGDSLVPTDDPTLLFTGAGMNQFKEMFLGRGRLSFRRAVTAQKCLRTGDIDNVGRTAGHHTFFEMLGNFSFGDYFKREAIRWAWEFMTRELAVDAGKLAVSVYEGDDEAYAIWKDEVGVPAERIYRYGAHDNFWPADAPALGPNGPCGPCSEIFVDQGKELGCGKPDCGPSCDCGRYVEVWNLVFTQFDRKDGGVLEALPNKNIDTGMGLERMVAVLQGKPNNFETELFMPLLDEIARTSGKPYRRQDETGPRMRRIADHARAVTFCIADGVLAGNEGRGYVERKLIRIATNDGLQLGIDKPFLYRLVPIVSEIMGRAYPEVKQRREYIARVVKAEEEKFLQTLSSGLRALRQLEKDYGERRKSVLSGTDLFRLFDTYGLPPEVTHRSTDLAVNERTLEEFEAEMARQRELARAGSRMAGDIFVSGALGQIRERIPATDFLGYETTEAEGTVLAVAADEMLMEEVGHDPERKLTVVLDRSPFYGEQGGQVGERGKLTGPDLEFVVEDSQISEGHILHLGRLVKGTLRTGMTVLAAVDRGRRDDVRRNHTATHLLHAALAEVLGKHAEQSGSLVAPDYFRFDFTHFEALTDEQVEKLEEIVNEKIRQDVELQTEETEAAEAVKSGAKALFGEKYGDLVRVVSVGPFSRELCGGTHCARTGQIGVFRITAEESVASGTRRITGLTGRYALARWRQQEGQLGELSRVLGAPMTDLVKRAESITDDNRTLRKELERLKSAKQTSAAADLLTEAPQVGGVKVVVSRLADGLGPQEIRQTLEKLMKSGREVAAVLASVSGAKVMLVSGLTEAARGKGLAANELVKKVAEVVGGGGGGRPEMAQAGGTKADKTEDALELARKLLTEALGT